MASKDRSSRFPQVVVDRPLSDAGASCFDGFVAAEAIQDLGYGKEDW